MEAKSKKLNLKIVENSCMLGPRWSACSLRSATAMLQAYAELYEHFFPIYITYNKGFILANTNIVRYLALIIDILGKFQIN